LRAGTSAPPIAAAFPCFKVGFYAAGYTLRRGNNKFKVAGIPVIPAFQDHNLFFSFRAQGER
jgi:hypothetical protein